MQRNGTIGIALRSEKHAELGSADADCVLQHCLEHGLKLARRARDHPQHLRRSGLLRELFAQLVEQAGILDRDDRLAREIRQQLDLLLGERAYLLAID